MILQYQNNMLGILMCHVNYIGAGYCMELYKWRYTGVYFGREGGGFLRFQKPRLKIQLCRRTLDYGIKNKQDRAV